ncbi:hypothetical protein ACHAQD_008403 [Fusarium lateritium]
MDMIEGTVDLMVSLWRRLQECYVGTIGRTDQEAKEFMFAVWAVDNIAPRIVNVVCERLFSDIINSLSQPLRSLLNTAANTLNRSTMVVWFVLGKTSSNAKIGYAFAQLPGQPAQLEIQCRLVLVTNRVVVRSSVIRDTLKGLGADVWSTPRQPASKVSNLATASLANLAVSGSVVPTSPATPLPVVAPGSEGIPEMVLSSGPDRISETPELDRGHPAVTQAFYLATSRLTAPVVLPNLLPPGQGLLQATASPGPDPQRPLAFGSSPVYTLPKKPSDDSPLGHGKRQAVHVEPPSLKATLQTSHYKRPQVPFGDFVASISRTLAPRVWLNDDIINTAVARLASGNIGAFNSLRLRPMFETKSIILFPVNDHLSSHWRLYVWEAGTLWLHDPLEGSPNNTTGPVCRLVAEASGAEASEVTRVDAGQQPNSIDCGLFVIAFAEIKAGGTGHCTGINTITRDNLAFEPLSSRAAMLPSPVHSGPLLSLAVNVHQSLSSLRLRLTNWTLPYPPAVSQQAITIEHHQFGQCILQSTAAGYHRRHEVLVIEAITKELALKGGLMVSRDDIWALYNESVVTILILRYMKVIYEATEMKIAELSR